jgi:hypothetical protein
MKCVVEICLVGMMYIPSFMTIGYGIQVILGLSPQEFERPQCCY